MNLYRVEEDDKGIPRLNTYTIKKVEIEIEVLKGNTCFLTKESLPIAALDTNKLGIDLYITKKEAKRKYIRKLEDKITDLQAKIELVEKDEEWKRTIGIDIGRGESRTGIAISTEEGWERVDKE